MSITGELKFVDIKPTAETLKLLYGETWGKGYDMGFDEGFASADDWYVDHADELAEHGWVKLPVDADGEYIRVGDKLDGYKETIVVDEMALQYGSWALVSDDRRAFYCPEAFTHHKTTVEDALREFTRDWCNSACTGDMTNAERDAAQANVIAEYAAKLRLTNDVEEQ